jgi:hypothetical protein
MTKTIAKLDTSAILIVTPAPDVATKPQSVQVSGPVAVVLQQIAILIRAGYTPSVDLPMLYFEGVGAMSITLILGSPDVAYIQLANEKLADAAALQAIQYTADVRRAAEVMIANEKAAEAAATKAKAIAEHQASVAKLQAEIAAM